MIAAMCRISKCTNLYPKQLFLKDPPQRLEVDPVDYGRFGEVYKITLEGKNMCFKAIKKYRKIGAERIQKTIDKRESKVYANEAIPWAQLSHQNILPFYGLAKIGSRLAFVSPWAANGNLKEYLSKHPGTDRLLLCKDTATGMEYLHQNDIVHGDLKGVNVLIDSAGRAVLGDFGLSSVIYTEIPKWSTQSTMASKGGTIRWQAPELFLDRNDPSKEVYNTKESDMFAWASVCYEIFTGHIPYYQISKLVSVALSIVQGKKPTCPEDSDAAWHQHGLTRRMWGLMEECWAFQAIERPNMTHKKLYADQAILWAQLSHLNILPFYGLARIGLRLAFVSPWATNGDLVEYLSHNSNANRLQLCVDTAAGMEYLHQNNITDSSKLNVLIDSNGRAVLGGFGLSSVTDSKILEWDTQSIMASKGGTVRWQAPELLMDQEDSSEEIYNTEKSDIFAWAGVCYEIFTGHIPYYQISKLVSVALSIVQGKKPTCPEDSDAAWHQHGLTQQMWGLLEECWAFQAGERPDASAVVERLRSNVGPDMRGPREWTDGPAMRLRRGEGLGDVGEVKFWEDLDLLLARLVHGLKTGNIA
ncbi:hypothetical protein C0993_005035 [Termitomyces sp. T159_Od127]|nr:hypothetical protein C0993_005035 [Termitomyces sp. T159_Od127]